MPIVKFNASLTDRRLVKLIVKRAIGARLVRSSKGEKKHWYLQRTLEMDLIATHANGCPMDFRRLLDADDFTFVHDIAGIARHISRETGKLGGHFLPRTHARVAA